jgi:hypothetical protein
MEVAKGQENTPRKKMSRRTMLTLALVATTGCSSFRNQDPKEDLDCSRPMQTTKYALDAMLPLGFTGQEAIDTLLGERSAQIRWEDESTEPARVVGQTNADSVRYSWYPEAPEGCAADTADTAGPRPSWMETKEISFSGTLQIVTTESSNLNESIEVSFDVEHLESASLFGSWASGEFEGDYLAPTCEECESTGTNVSGRFQPTSSNGTITVLGTLPWCGYWVTQVDTGYPAEPSPVTLATIKWY